MSTTTTVPINSSSTVTSKSASDSNSYGGSGKNYHQQQREQSTLSSTVTINNRENANSNNRNNLHHLSKKSNSSSGGSNNSIQNTSSSSLATHQQPSFNVTSHQPLPNLNPFTNITNHQHHSQNQNLIEIKSKFEAEFRRFSVQRSEITNLEDFIKLIEHFHKLFTISFCLFYTDPNHGDLLPINNDTNFALAIASAKPLLRLIVQRKGESYDYLNNYGKKKTNFLGTILPVVASSSSKNRLAISAPEDFRQVSSIIDVDIVPETCRRVRLVKHGSDKPLGFYIRDGSSVRITERGLQKVPGIFISRLVPGGLAESTGLLAESDEVLEVNGIEVNGKSLDQVTDMMVANSSNLIITIRPANQRAGHNTLSSSYSSNTISNHHPSATLQHVSGGTMTTDRHHYHHSNNNYYNQHHHHHHHHLHHHPNSAQQYTNSLERSGHRSKVADYYPSYQPRHDSSASYHQQYLHHRTSSDVIEDDDDDDDEDEVRDHINVNNNDGCNNGSTSNNVTLAASSSSSSSLMPNKSTSAQLLTASVFSIPPPTTNATTLECITIGPVKGGNTNNNHHNNNNNNGSSTGVNSANSSNTDSDIVTL